MRLMVVMIVMKKGQIYMGKDNNVIVAQVVYKGLIDLVIVDKIKIDEESDICKNTMT